MLEKIKVSPDVVQGVVGLTIRASALRTREFTASRKVDIDVEPFLLRIERSSAPRTTVEPTPVLSEKDRCPA